MLRIHLSIPTMWLAQATMWPVWIRPYSVDSEAPDGFLLTKVRFQQLVTPS
jgi:hypothetical protein